MGGFPRVSVKLKYPPPKVYAYMCVHACRRGLENDMGRSGKLGAGEDGTDLRRDVSEGQDYLG